MVEKRNPYGGLFVDPKQVGAYQREAGDAFGIAGSYQEPLFDSFGPRKAEPNDWDRLWHRRLLADKAESGKEQ